MLFDYVAPSLQAGHAGTVWSQFPLQPLAPGALTPFSYSVLAEIASRAWYVYYDRLGFDPVPRSKVVRQYKGHAYFNLSLCAQLEADNAGIEPLLLRLNDQRQPLATWEKPSFLAGLKLGRAQKRIDETWANAARQIGNVTEKAHTWYLKTQGIRRWGQAEVLQIMEEIERIGLESMVTYLAARMNLGQLYTGLVADLSDKVTPAQAILLINNALCGVSGLVESDLLKEMAALAQSMREPATLAWLKKTNAATWHVEAPSAQTPSVGKEAQERANKFLSAYGHWAALGGEIATPRWSEDGSLLRHALLAQIETPRPAPQQALSANLQTLFNALPPSARKQGEKSLAKISELHVLQSRSLNALSYIWAGTRSWALAAAREAMVDKRLQSVDEVFLFELEEIKEMMTGEWNISSLDEIRATVAQRQVDYAAIRDGLAPDLLVNDDEAFATHRGLPGVAGKATGPLTFANGTTTPQIRDAILATKSLDSGHVLTLPIASGFVAAAGSPCDPFVVVAQGWQQPVAVGLGKSYEQFGMIDGTPTTREVHVEVNAGLNAGLNAEVNGDGVAITTRQ